MLILTGGTDIDTLVPGGKAEREGALKKYSEEQFAAVKLPGGGKEVCLGLDMQEFGVDVND